MRKFDPWPIFFRREWNRNWPFLVGFAVTGTIITKLSLGLTEEDAKNSRFVQRHNGNAIGFLRKIYDTLGPPGSAWHRISRIFVCYKHIGT